MDTKHPVNTQQATDEADIRHLVQQMKTAWNRGDSHAFAALFTADADFVIIDGVHVSSRQAIAEGHQQIFDTIYKDSQNRAVSIAVRFVRTDVALAHVRWHLRFWQNNAQAERQTISTLVLIKSTTPDQYAWQITAFQNTPVSAAE